MSDIVERLRAWVYTDSQYATAREAADEIERLRLSYAASVQRLAHETARLRLSARGDCPEPENAAKQDIPPLAAGGRAAIRDGGSGNLRPPHPTPVRSSPVTDGRPAPTAKLFVRENMTTLTPLERCVLREVRHGYADIDDVRCNEIAYVIDRMLSRTGSDDANAGEGAAKCTVKGKELPERELVTNHQANLDSSTLTAAEREAVAMAYSRLTADTHYASVAATLRGLLERLG